jgi:dTDP-glucose pyrophosphorylase
MDSNQLLINKNKNIIEALAQLSTIRDYSKLILFVIDDDNKILGSLTDGDIRRSLLEHKDLYKKLVHICRKDFSFCYENNKYISFKALTKNNTQIIPILNKDKTLNRIIDLKKQTCVLPIESVIMAGGRGKRLSPLTDSTPKPMLKLGDKPIIEHNIDKLNFFGIKKIHISVNYLGEKIMNHFGNGKNKNIDISYINEDQPLGTAGALSLIKNIKSDYILLMNSDLFTNINLEKMYNKMIDNEADMIIASTDYKVSIPYAIFEKKSSNNIISLVEKPTYTYNSNAGIYMFKKELVNKIPKNEFFDITDLIVELIKENLKIINYPIAGYWIDIGKLEDFNKAKELLKNQNK